MEEKMKKVNILVVCLLLASCAPVLNNVDLLSENICDAPCLLGITPGVTTQSEARIIIDNNTLLSDCKEYDNREQGGFQWIDCNSKSFGVVFVDDIVTTISIAPSDFSVEQLIQKYGPPDALSIMIVSRPDDPFRSKAIFRYDKIQMWVTLIEKPGTMYELTQDTLVEAIVFERENEYEMTAKTILDTWRGYGTYPSETRP